MSCLRGHRRRLRQRLYRSVMPVATSLTAVFALAQPVVAQTEPALARGARLRVVIPAVDGQPERYVPGALVRLAGDTVVLLTGWGPAGPDTLVYALAEGGGRRLERVAGSYGHGGTGAALGAVFGALVGGVVASVTWQPCTQQGPFACLLYPSRGVRTAAGVVRGAAGGALVGLVIGRAVRTETWEPLRTAGVRLGIAPRAVGISLAL